MNYTDHWTAGHSNSYWHSETCLDVLDENQNLHNLLASGFRIIPSEEYIHAL